MSHKWLISPEEANRTVQYNTQPGIRTILHLYLSRWLKTDYRALKYNILQQNVFTDTMQEGNVFQNNGLICSSLFLWVLLVKGAPNEKEVICAWNLIYTLQERLCTAQDGYVWIKGADAWIIKKETPKGVLSHRADIAIPPMEITGWGDYQGADERTWQENGPIWIT